MKDGNFYQIAGWMGNRLGLRGNELICFAIIYGFSQDGESQFKGNLNYLSDFMFCSKPTAMLCLEKLIKLDLIRKEEAIVKGKKRCYYSVTVNFEDGHLEYIDKENTGKEPLPMTGKEPLPMTGKEPLPINNNSNINSNNKEKRLSNDNQKNEEYSDDFLAFWKAYGYSRDKGTTYKRWNKLSEKDKKAALAALPAYFADCERCKRDKRYPAVYLNKRTWEDDFTSPEDKEEKEESPAVDEAEMAQWKKTQGWLYANVPRIADRIFQEDFEEMKRKARYKSDIVAEILKEINDSYFNGNNLSEFCVLAESDKYRNRIEA